MHIDIKKTYQADVVVCGAGTAGAVAAIAAADAGASVILIEQFGAAGGTSTLGLVTPLMHTGIEGNPQGSYVAKEIIARMAEVGAVCERGSSFFDPMMLTVILDEMFLERKIQVLYHTTVVGAEKGEGHLEKIIVYNKSGFAEVKANHKFVDATADCDVVAHAGLPFLQGDEETHRNQPCSLRYVLENVDVDAFWQYLEEKRNRPNGEILPRPKNFDDGLGLTSEKHALFNVFVEAVEKGDLTRDDHAYWQFFTVPGRPDCLAFNCPEFFDVPDVTDAEQLSRVQMEGKLRVMRFLRFYKKYFKGFENATVSTIAPMVGIRESRRAVTEHVLTAGEAIRWQKFDDAVVRSNYPVDVHGYMLRNEYIEGEKDSLPYYEIPFRALVVKGMDNLLVAGRCIGTEFVAQASVRIIPTCRALGEAAGIAAALNTLDGKVVRAEMAKKGAEY